MENIKKRIISVLFVLLILCNFMFIPVYADDVSDVYALFTTDWGHSVLKNQYYQYLNQTDDDFYMNHMQNFNFDGTYYQIQQFANRVECAGLNAVAPVGLQIVGNIVYDNLEIETGAKYKSAIVDRELLLAMDNTIVQNIGQNGVRYTSLDELGITTVSPINTTAISVVYGDQVCPFIGKTFSHDGFNSFYNISVAQTITNQVSVYTGGAMPPAFYVPSNCTVYQSGTVLSPGFYVILGTSELFGINYNYNSSSRIYLGFGWTNPTDSVQDSIIHYAYGSSADGSPYYSSNAVYIWKNGVKESSSFFQKFDTNGRAWTYINLLNNLSGFMIDVDESPTTNAPDTFLPETVPYDDNDFVYVFIPVDNSNNVSYGDIIYMNPEDYDTYVNNGTIVEGDYINSYSYDTASSIIDSYNTYITNNTTNNNNTTNFDDSRIVSKLDHILQKLTEIKNKISDVSVSVESWDTPISTIKREYPDVFSNEPCYDNFSDCVTLSLPVVADIQEMLENLQSPGAKSADEELSRFKSDTNSNTLPAPSGSGDTDTFPNQTSTSTTKSLFSNFAVDLSWYEPYRIRVRSILKIGVWVFGIVTYWQLIKSIFGIRLHNFEG